MRTPLTVGLLLILALPAWAGDPVSDGADKVAAAAKAQSTATLEKLAADTKLDPWLVLDSLCDRGKHDAAFAFAAAASKPAFRGMAAYVASRRGKAEPENERAAATAASTALGANDMKAVLAATSAPSDALDTVARIRSAHARGRALIATGQGQEGISLLVQTSEAAERIGWLFVATSARFYAGVGAYRANDPEGAAAAWELALATSRVAGNVEWQRKTHGNLGDAYKVLARYEDAQEHFEASLRRAKALGHRAGALAATQGLTLLLMVRGRYREALKHSQQGLLDAREARDISGETIAHSHMGTAYWRLGNNAAALAAYEEGLALAKQAGKPDHVSGLLDSLCNLLRSIGRPHEAIAYGKRAIVMARKEGNRAREATALANTGTAHYDIKEHAKAKELLEAAVKIMSAPGGDRVKLAAALSNLGLAFQGLGRTLEAVQHYMKAVDVGRAVGADAYVARSLMAIAAVHNEGGVLKTARWCLDEARKYMGEAPALDIKARFLGIDAKTTLREGKLVEALALVKAAVRLGVSMSQGLAAEEGAAARDRFAVFFDLGIEIAVQAEDADALVWFLEHGRSGALRETLGSRAQLEAAVIPPPLLAALRKARAQEHRALATYQGTARRGKRGPTRRAKAAWEAARAEVARSVERIEREAKRAAVVTLAEPDSLAVMQGRLRADDALLLYGSTSKTGVVLVVRRDQARMIDLGSMETIDKAVDALLANDEQSVVPGAASKLRKLIVDPLGLGADVRRILVSPTGRLAYVPYILMVPGRDVVHVPSGTALGLLAEVGGQGARGVLALGDPDYAVSVHSEARKRLRSGRTGSLPPLPATRAEVEAISTVSLLGRDATEAGLRSAISKSARWKSVHFACHGLVHAQTPAHSSLALTATADEDGFLTCNEIIRMTMPADLVVLSACETGKGRIYRAEGIVGFTMSFMFAGASRVMCSLWKVDDEATRALMVKFYELWNPESGKALTASAALRQAQEHVRAQKKWAHPHYWAAWVLWGLPE